MNSYWLDDYSNTETRLESFNLDDVNSEISRMLEKATTGFEYIDGDHFNIVNTSVLLGLIEKRFGNEFAVFLL